MKKKEMIEKELEVYVEKYWKIMFDDGHDEICNKYNYKNNIIQSLFIISWIEDVVFNVENELLTEDSYDDPSEFQILLNNLDMYKRDCDDIYKILNLPKELKDEIMFSYSMLFDYYRYSECGFEL